MSDPHKFMLIIRKAPHGSIYVHEAIEVMFIMATFDMDLSIVFLDDGVFAVKKGQDTSEIGIKGFSKSLGALGYWDVTKIYADEQSLKDRNLSADDLVTVGEDEDTEEKLYPKILSSDELSQMMHEQDSVLSF